MSAPITKINSAEADPLLTTEQAASKLGVSPRTVRRMRKRGDGPPFIMFSTRTHRYRKVDIDAWMNGGGVQAHKAGAKAAQRRGGK